MATAMCGTTRACKASLPTAPPHTPWLVRGYMLGPSPLLSRRGVPQHIDAICASRAGLLYPAPSSTHSPLPWEDPEQRDGPLVPTSAKCLTLSTQFWRTIPPPLLETQCIRHCRLEAPHTPRVALPLHPTPFYTLPYPLQVAARQNSKSEWPLNQFLALNKWEIAIRALYISQEWHSCSATLIATCLGTVSSPCVSVYPAKSLFLYSLTNRRRVGPSKTHLHPPPPWRWTLTLPTHCTRLHDWSLPMVAASPLSTPSRTITPEDGHGATARRDIISVYHFAPCTQLHLTPPSLYACLLAILLTHDQGMWVTILYDGLAFPLCGPLNCELSFYKKKSVPVSAA